MGSSPDIPEEERERLEAAAASDETWTVMLYLAGSDLEENGRASDNLREIMAAEPAPSVNVFIQSGTPLTGSMKRLRLPP